MFSGYNDEMPCKWPARFRYTVSDRLQAWARAVSELTCHTAERTIVGEAMAEVMNEHWAWFNEAVEQKVHQRIFEEVSRRPEDMEFQKRAAHILDSIRRHLPEPADE